MTREAIENFVNGLNTAINEDLKRRGIDRNSLRVWELKTIRAYYKSVMYGYIKTEHGQQAYKELVSVSI